MSFGVGIGDVIKLIELTTQTYQGWKHACGNYAQVTADLHSLKIVLARLAEEISNPSSLSARPRDGLSDLQGFTDRCQNVVARLNKIVTKYKSLGSNQQRNWDRLRLGNKGIKDLQEILTRQMTLLNAYSTCLASAS